MTEKPDKPKRDRVQIDFKAWPEIKHLTEQMVTARKAAGYTQLQAAKIMGTGQSYLADLENGYVNPSFQLLAQMARAYKVPMTTFCLQKAVNRRPDAPRSARSQKPSGPPPAASSEPSE